LYPCSSIFNNDNNIHTRTCTYREKRKCDERQNTMDAEQIQGIRKL